MEAPINKYTIPMNGMYHLFMQVKSRIQLSVIWTLFLPWFLTGFSLAQSPPTANCHANVVVYLDGNGSGLLLPAQVDSNSFDNDTIIGYSLSQSSFSCPPGVVTTTLTVTDDSSLTDNCTANVHILDTTIVAVCDSFVIQLDSSAPVTLSPQDVDGGSNSACGIMTMTVSPNTFTWSDTASQSVTLTVTSFSGSSSSCLATVSGDTCKYYYDHHGPCYSMTPSSLGSPYIDMVDHGNNCAQNDVRVSWVGNGPSQVLTTTGVGCSPYKRRGCNIMVYDPAATFNCHCNRPEVLMTSCTDSCTVECPGDSLPLLDPGIVGGVPPYTYIWSTGATTPTIQNVPVGTHSVTVTDALGQQVVITFCIAANQIITISDTVIPSCPNVASGAVDITTTCGCGNLTYLWSNGQTTEDISGVNSGSYSVTVTDAFGTTATASFFVTQLSLCSASFTTNITSLTVTFNNTSQSATSYIWDFGDGNNSTTANPTHTYANQGTYTVCLIATNNCGSNTSCLDVMVNGTGSNENILSMLRIYPNPASGSFMIENAGSEIEKATVKIHDLVGRELKILEFIPLPPKTEIQIEGFPPSIYTVTIEEEDGRKAIFRIQLY